MQNTLIRAGARGIAGLMGVALVLALGVLIAGSLVACPPPGAVVEAPILPSDAGTLHALLEPPDAGTSATDAHAAESGTFANGQIWRGFYTCAQGRTKLALHIVKIEDTTVEAVFEFEHEASSTTGSFHMTGDLDLEAKRAHFEAGEWIDQPANYETVNLDGELKQNGSFSGRVDGSGCSNFYLRLAPR